MPRPERRKTNYLQKDKDVDSCDAALTLHEMLNQYGIFFEIGPCCFCHKCPLLEAFLEVQGQWVYASNGINR